MELRLGHAPIQMHQYLQQVVKKSPSDMTQQHMSQLSTVTINNALPGSCTPAYVLVSFLHAAAVKHSCPP